MSSTSKSSMTSTFPSTSFTRLFNVTKPIILGPMAGASTPALVAAVCNAGGVGSLAAARLQADDMRRQVAEIRRLTDKPFAINLFIPPTNPEPVNESYREDVRHILHRLADLRLKHIPKDKSLPPDPNYDEQLQVMFESKPAAFTWTFGCPTPDVMQRCKREGIITIGTATTLEEAIVLVDAGCDALTVQGSEAGGHRGSFLTDDKDTIEMSTIGLATLLNQIAAVVPEHIVLLAAGGIANGETLASAITLGAAAGQVGTRFLTAHENTSVHKLHRELLLAPGRARAAGDAAALREALRPTVLTRAYSGKPARGLYTEFIKCFSGVPSLPWFVQSHETVPYTRAAAKEGVSELLQMWAGQNYMWCKETSAQEIVDELVNDAAAILRRRSN